MIEIEKLRTQVSEIDDRLTRSDGELANRARKIRERIEAVQEGLVAKAAELKRKAGQLDELKSENEELKKLFSRLLGLFENRQRIHFDQELADLGAKVDSLADLAKAEVKEVLVEWDASKADPGSPTAGPKPSPSPQKYDIEWFRKVQQRVDSLSEDIKLAEHKEESGPKSRWNDKAYGSPPGSATKKTPNEAISIKTRQSNVA